MMFMSLTKPVFHDVLVLCKMIGSDVVWKSKATAGAAWHHCNTMPSALSFADKITVYVTGTAKCCDNCRLVRLMMMAVDAADTQSM